MIHNSNENILTPKQLMKIASGFDGIICQGNLVDKEYIEKNKETLKAISNVSVGYDNVDMKSAIKNKIAVFNTPNILEDTVADFTMGMIIAVARKICDGNNYVKSEKWQKNSWPLFLGEELNGEILGILGMGNIGKKVAERAKAFNLKIIYHNRNRLSIEEEKKYFASYYDLKSLLQHSKYLLILAPLNSETKYLMNKKTFSMMRKDSYLINIARGKIVKEKDLVQALENKVIAGAALDVFENEPKIDKKLMNLKNTVLMPHAGSATLTTRNKMIELACKNISDFFISNKKYNLVDKSYL